MKKWLKYLVAGVLIPALIVAGILEGAIRIFHLIPDDVPAKYHAVPGDEAFAPDPNSSSRSIFGILHRTDSHGLRGPERSLERWPGRTRVAVVGDSVVWGYGVPEDDTIPAWLERLSRDRGTELEAWNLGVTAYNTYNERAKFAQLAPLLRPDVTVVVVLFNDLQAEAQTFRITSARTLADRSFRAPYPDEWRPILEKSALFRAAVLLYFRNSRQSRPVDLAYLPGIVGQLDQIVDIARGVGSAMIVAAMPSAREDEQFVALSKALREFCAKQQITFVDLSTALGNPARREYLLPADPIHPTAEGARVIAQAIVGCFGRTAEDALRSAAVRHKAPHQGVLSACCVMR